MTTNDSPARSQGVIVVDKPSGPTSFDVVRKIRRLFQTKKVGHTGTLDPLATGVLAICLNDATRIVPYLTDSKKEYRATIRLGAISTTYDSEGVIESCSHDEALKKISESNVRQTLEGFLGTQSQVPPIYSAIKVDGQRAYARARRGESFELKARTVEIFEAELLDFDKDLVVARIVCSKGTYIRSIAHDLGQRLGVGGLLCGLRRTRVGDLRIEDAIDLETIVSLDSDALDKCCLSVKQALSSWTQVTLAPSDVKNVQQGRKIVRCHGRNEPYLALDPTGSVIALMEGSVSTPCKILRGFPSV